MRPEAIPSKPFVPTGSKNTKLIAITVILLVVIALVATGSLFYLKDKADKEYKNNFVKATYCVQMGADTSLKASAKILAEWKSKMEAGQPYIPRPSMDEEKALGIINNKLETVSLNLTKAPDKFSQCNEKLAKLKAVYDKLRSLVLSPGNSLQNFTDTSIRLNGEYQQAVKEFKSGMPEEMMAELISAAKRYRGLRPLLN